MAKKNEQEQAERERLYKEKHLVCKAEPGSLTDIENKSQRTYDLMWEDRLAKFKTKNK